MSRQELLNFIHTYITSNNRREVSAEKLRAVLSAFVDAFYNIEEDHLLTSQDLPAGVIAPGGLFGQVLTKSSDNDYEVNWQDIPITHLQNTDIGTNSNSFTLGIGGISPAKIVNSNGTLFLRNNADNDYLDLVVKSITFSNPATIIDSNTVNIGDNIIVLNADEIGSPSQDAGFDIERGTGINAYLRWIESSKNWVVGDDAGTQYGLFYKADNGLSRASGVVNQVGLGGTISEATVINGANWDFRLGNKHTSRLGVLTLSASTINAGYFSTLLNRTSQIDTLNGGVILGTGSTSVDNGANYQLYMDINKIDMSARNNTTQLMSFKLTNTQTLFTDSRTTKLGIEYAADYSADFTTRSLVDKGYVDNATSPLGTGKVNKSGDTMTGFLTLSANPSANLHAATKQYVDSSIAGLVNSSPATLDTLNELATALGNDPNFATTITSLIGTKESSSNKNATNGYAGLTSGLLAIAQMQGLLNDAGTTDTDKTWTNSKIKTYVDASVASGASSPTTYASMSAWGGVMNAKYIIVGTALAPVANNIPTYNPASYVNLSEVYIWSNNATDPLQANTGWQKDGAYSYSPSVVNLIKITNLGGTPVVQVIQAENISGSAFSSALALNPKVAFDFREVTTGATTVANQGSEGGTAAKTGTFTGGNGTGNGLICGAGGDIRYTLNGGTAVALGDGGNDWWYLIRFKIPAGMSVSSQRNLFSIYRFGSESSNNMRFRNGAGTSPAVDDGKVSMQRNYTSPATAQVNLTVGSTKVSVGPPVTLPKRTLLFVKRGTTINVYEDGGIGVITTSTLVASSVYDLNRLAWFAVSQFGSSSYPLDLEVDYCAFDWKTTISTGEENTLKNLMLLTQ